MVMRFPSKELSNECIVRRFSDRGTSAATADHDPRL
jgi:hypothetical protein